MVRALQARWVMSVLVRATPFFALLICAASSSFAGSIAETLISADMDVIVTINTREIFQDFRDDTAVQRYLDQWRYAARDDGPQLREYYTVEEVQRYEGLTLQEFLDRSSVITSACQAFGNDPFEDVDFITLGYSAGDPGSLAVVVEGKFKQLGIDRLEKFFRQNLFPVNQGDGPSLGTLNGNAFVYADSRKTLNLLQARAAEAKSNASPGVRALLDAARKKQFSIVVNNFNPNIERLLKFLSAEMTGPVGIDPEFTRTFIGRLSDWTRQYGSDLAAFSLGLSIGDDERRWEMGIDAKSPEKVEVLRSLIDLGGLLGQQLLKSNSSDFARSWASGFSKQRVTLKETTLVLQIDVPDSVIPPASKDPQAGSKPDSIPANQKRLSSREEAQNSLRRISSIPLWKLDAPVADITEVLDVPYKSGPEGETFRHQLDLHLPRGKKEFPVVVLVHGGGWVEGDNRCAGLYSSVGQFLATQGIGVVMPNYRLSPGVKHPEHIKDVASAVAWTKSHIGEYGGDIRRLYLLGHSAGGHLVSLLVADESFLKAEGMSGADIKGVIAVSGVYRIMDGIVYGALLGGGPRALKLEQNLPLRGDNWPTWKWNPPGWHLAAKAFELAFDDSSELRAAASPVTRVRSGMPPFLLFAAENDLPLLEPMAQDFFAALRGKDCDARLVVVRGRNHNSVMFSAISTQDPVARSILEFLQK